MIHTIMPFLIILLLLPLVYVYMRKRKRVWTQVLHESIQYHRYHLIMARENQLLSTKSREISRGMLYVIDRQLKNDFNRKQVNLKGFLKSIIGAGTSLQLSAEIHYQIMRFHYDIDEIIIRLYITFSSTLYRLFFLNSILLPLSILFMDILNLASLISRRKSGPLCLFRDIIKQIQNDKICQ